MYLLNRPSKNNHLIDTIICLIQDKFIQLKNNFFNNDGFLELNKNTGPVKEGGFSDVRVAATASSSVPQYLA